MLLQRSRSKIGKLEFREIPTYGTNDLPELIGDIALRRKKFWKPSYGAFLIKAGGKAVWDESTKFTAAMRTEINLDTQTRTNTFDAADAKFSDLPPHTDVGQSKNDVSSHFTEQGSAEVIVFDNAQGMSFMQRSEGAQVLEKLFEQGRYELALSASALRGTLEANDILLFDSSLVHAFRSLTPDRLSRVRYF